MIVKIITTDTQYKRFKKTNFLYVLKENEPILCSKCNNPIDNDTYCYICSDLNKIWHELCIDDEHIKHNFIIFGKLKQHSDWFCLIRYLPKKVFDAFKVKPIDLDI